MFKILKAINTVLDKWALKRLSALLDKEYVTKNKVLVAYNSINTYARKSNPASIALDAFKDILMQDRECIDEGERTKLEIAAKYYSVDIRGQTVYMGSQQAYERGYENGKGVGKATCSDTLINNIKVLRNRIYALNAEHSAKRLANDMLTEIESLLTSNDCIAALDNLPKILGSIKQNSDNISISELEEFIISLSKVHNSSRYKRMVEFVEQRSKKATSN